MFTIRCILLLHFYLNQIKTSIIIQVVTALARRKTRSITEDKQHCAWSVPKWVVEKVSLDIQVELWKMVVLSHQLWDKKQKRLSPISLGNIYSLVYAYCEKD